MAESVSNPAPTRVRLLRVALKHYSGAGLCALLRVSDETLVSWLEEKADIPDTKMLRIIDLLDGKSADGEDF